MAIEWIPIYEKEPEFRKDDLLITSKNEDGKKTFHKHLLVMIEANSKLDIIKGFLSECEGDIYIATDVDYFFKDINWEGEMTGARILYWAEINFPKDMAIFSQREIH